MERIKTSDGYLYCDVNINASDNAEYYDDANDYFLDLVDDIEIECECRGYSERETEMVKDHYSIIINNANVEWRNKIDFVTFL